MSVVPAVLTAMPLNCAMFLNRNAVLTAMI